MPSMIMVDDLPQLLEFLKTVFDAEITDIADDGFGKIWSAKLRIGDKDMVFADTRKRHPAQPTNIYLYVKSAVESYERAITAGAEHIEYGVVRDPAGNTWWLADAASADQKKDSAIRAA